MQNILRTGTVRSLTIDKKVEQIVIQDISTSSTHAIFTLQSPLKFSYEAGIDIFETNMDESNDIVSIVQDDVEVTLIQDESYDPNANSPIPTEIDVKYAFFVTPEKRGFDQGYTLFPTPQPELNTDDGPFKDHPWYSQYSVIDDRRHFVENYQMTDYDLQSCRPLDTSIIDNRTYNCITEMPPHKVIEYSHVTHINNKWNYTPALKTYLKKNGIESEPEHVIRFQHEYEFQHDARAENVEKLFRSTGDSDSTNHYARKFYMDSGIGSSFRPANNPLLHTKVSIELSPFAVDDIKSDSSMETLV